MHCLTPGASYWAPVPSGWDAKKAAAWTDFLSALWAAADPAGDFLRGLLKTTQTGKETVAPRRRGSGEEASSVQQGPQGAHHKLWEFP